MQHEELLEEVRAARAMSPARARSIRKTAGISQERMAEALGVHRLTLARWEAGLQIPRGSRRNAYFDLLEALERETTRE